MQVQVLQLKVKPNTPPEERKIWDKLNDASMILKQLNVVEPDCTNLHKVSLAVYEKFLTTPKM